MRWLAIGFAVLAGCGMDGGAQCPSTLRPSARSQVNAVVTPATNQIYALGGQTAAGTVDELWRWTFGACGGWARLQLASTPGPRANYAAALDESRHRILYIGGAAQNDVWALDTDRLSFTKLAAVGTPPVAAAAEVAAYDGMHNRVVYAGIETYTLEFGKSDQGDWMFADATSLQAPASGTVDPTRAMLFVLDGAGLHGYSLLTSVWHDVSMHGDVPPAGARLLWDGTGKQLVAVGDGVFAGPPDASGGSVGFTRMATTGDPPARADFAAAISGDVLWIFGGATAAGCILDDLWTMDLNSGAWTNVWPATTCL
jgi:Kelch motif